MAIGSLASQPRNQESSGAANPREGLSPRGGHRRFFKRVLRIGLLLAGFALVAWITLAVGWPAVQANLARIGGWFLLLTVLYTLAQLAFALGWWVVIDPPRRASLFPRVFAAYLAGDAVNYLAPGNVAGEPVKAHLLRETPETGRALASITIHKHADLFAQWVFALAGVAFSIWRFPLPRAAVVAALVGVAGLAGLLLLMTWALRRGTYSPILRGLARSKFLSARLERFQPAAQAADARIQEFYGARRGSFFAAAGWCLLGWCGGLLETYLILRLLSPSQGWATAFAIEALAMVLNNMLLWVPGRVGSAEGVRVGVFILLGLPAASGIAYSLARRARELTWIVPGLLVLAKRHVGWVGQAGPLKFAGLTSEEFEP